MEGTSAEPPGESTRSSTSTIQQILISPESSTSRSNNRPGWRVVNNTFEAVNFNFASVGINTINNNATRRDGDDDDDDDDDYFVRENPHIEPDEFQSGLCAADNFPRRAQEVPRDLQDTENHHHCEDNARTTRHARAEEQRTQSHEMQRQDMNKRDAIDSGIVSLSSLHHNTTESTSSIRSIGSFVCRICHNAEQPERLVSPCLCKGSLTYVHTYCLEYWISTSGKTTCELCQFHYKTTQTLRYTCLQSLRMWYSHSMSRRALQEDCQMFSLLTLVAFGIVGTILVGLQYYIGQERYSMTPLTRVWTKSWMLFFLFSTFTVYFLNVYMIARSQLAPWYRWWQSAREIKLILENRKAFPPFRRLQIPEVEAGAQLQDACQNVPIAEEPVTGSSGTIFVNLNPGENIGPDNGRRNTMAPIPVESDEISAPEINNQQQQQQQQPLAIEYRQPQDEQPGRQQQSDRSPVHVNLVDI